MEKLYPGLVSITFRNLSPAEVVKAAAEAGLKGIEWGGDVHVPHGDTKTAKKVAKLTADAGLKVAAYGSYFRAGEPWGDEGDGKNPSPDAVVASAYALGAPVIRVWAGKKASEEADEEYRRQVIDGLSVIADLAAEKKLRVSVEYHANTLTDDTDSAAALMSAVDKENLELYWQPPNGWSPDKALAGFKRVSQWVSNLHVFHWTFPEGEKIIHPLEKGRQTWEAYLGYAAALDGSRWALLEFVKDGSVTQLSEDSAVLIDMIQHAEEAL